MRFGHTSNISSLLLMVTIIHSFVDLGKYHHFFKLLLEEILVKCAKQRLYVVELRHIPGMIFNDDRHVIGLEEELDII